MIPLHAILGAERETEMNNPAEIDLSPLTLPTLRELMDRSANDVLWAAPRSYAYARAWAEHTALCAELSRRERAAELAGNVESLLDSIKESMQIASRMQTGALDGAGYLATQASRTLESLLEDLQNVAREEGLL